MSSTSRYGSKQSPQEDPLHDDPCHDHESAAPSVRVHGESEQWREGQHATTEASHVDTIGQGSSPAEVLLDHEDAGVVRGHVAHT